MVTIRGGFAGMWLLAMVVSALCTHPETILLAWALSLVALARRPRLLRPVRQQQSVMFLPNDRDSAVKWHLDAQTRDDLAKRERSTRTFLNFCLESVDSEVRHKARKLLEELNP